MSPQAPPDSVLVMRFSAAGDVILTAGAVAALHKAWPTTRILFAVKQSFAGLVRHNPDINEVIALEPGEGAWAFARRLRGLRPSVVLDLHRSTRSRFVGSLVGAERRVTYVKREFGVELPVRLGLRTYRATQRIGERYHRAVEALVGESLPPAPIRYHVGPDDQSEADAILAAAGIDFTRPLLGMSPGANWATKRWPAERFGALARHAVARGMQVVVTGSPQEAPLLAAVRAVSPDVIDLGARISLTALGGLLTRCTAFVAHDSAPMHMARALGVPTLAIFGSTDPGQFDFTGHGMLFAAEPCSPCHFYGRRSCPKGHFRCMMQIDVDRAWAALEPLLDGQRRALLPA